MRVPFNELFQVNPNGMISPKLRVNINGNIIGPGAELGSGAVVGGVNLHDIAGHQLEVEQQADGLVIFRGYY